MVEFSDAQAYRQHAQEVHHLIDDKVKVAELDVGKRDEIDPAVRREGLRKGELVKKVP